MITKPQHNALNQKRMAGPKTSDLYFFFMLGEELKVSSHQQLTPHPVSFPPPSLLYCVYNG